MCVYIYTHVCVCIIYTYACIHTYIHYEQKVRPEEMIDASMGKLSSLQRVHGCVSHASLEKQLVVHFKTKSFLAKSVYFICCLCALRVVVANKVPMSSLSGIEPAYH